MSYQVIARKWRPQTFDEVVYQDHVSRTIKNSIKNGRISHAYLFAGPRGVGKTTMARILAKSLNCVNGPTDSPCGVCRNCVEIRDGISFDVIEIDGASNRGIDNIRELRENVNSAPMRGRYKVYIVDEVHMLTPEAFNALLKTLEEPPAHVVFVFATTEAHKIPETILSRCQKYYFKKISIESIAAHLKHIVQKEGFRVMEDALYPVARAAEGSMRDAQSLLDQVVSFGGDEIRVEDALSILGVVPLGSYMELLRAVAAGDRAALVGEVDRVTGLGTDIPRYAAGLADVIRSIRLVKNGIASRDILGFSDEEIKGIRALAASFNDEELGLIFREAVSLQNDLRFSTNERIHLEMALLDMAAIKESPSIASIIERIEKQAGRPAVNAEKKAGTVPAAGSPPSSPAPHEGGKRAGGVKQGEAQRGGAPEGLESHWHAYISVLQGEGQYLHVKVKDAAVVYRDNALYLRYPAGAEYCGRMLDRRDLETIGKEMHRRTGMELPVRVDQSCLSADGAEMPPHGEVKAKNPGTADHTTVNPVVEKIKDVFHGQIINKGDK